MNLCPKCGNYGVTVASITVENLVKSKKVDPIPYYSCTNPECSVVYFGRNIYEVEDIKEKIWFKNSDLDTHICYCKSVTRGDIAKYVKTHSDFQLKDLLKYFSIEGKCNCLTKNPLGK